MKRGRFAEEQVIGVLIEVDTPITGQRVFAGAGTDLGNPRIARESALDNGPGFTARRWRPGRGEYG